MPTAPGRPRKASKAMLQDAAFELFQLRGYRDTSVEQIARTAGFSRATFFNFFSSKAEIFWVEADEIIASLRGTLRSCSGEDRPPSLRAALLRHAELLGGTAIPWALQNRQLLEANQDLVASGASRVLELDRMFTAYLRRQSDERGDLEARAEASVVTALLLTALIDWIDSGVQRGSFHERLDSLLETHPSAERASTALSRSWSDRDAE